MKPPSAISFFLVLKQIRFLLKIENTCFKAFRAGPDLLPSWGGYDEATVGKFVLLVFKQIRFRFKIENICFKAFRAGPDLLPS